MLIIEVDCAVSRVRKREDFANSKVDAVRLYLNVRIDHSFDERRRIIHTRSYFVAVN